MMIKFHQLRILGCFVVLASGLLVSPRVAQSEDKKAPEAVQPPKVPANLPISSEGVTSDPAFGRFVDLGLVRLALATGDAGLLTDAALLMAEGERKLRRTHRSLLSSRSLLEKATWLASESGDKKTLIRISGYLGSIKSQSKQVEQLRSAVKQAINLSGASRRVEPKALREATDSSADAAALLGLIKNAERIDDASLLDFAENNVNAAKDLSKEAQSALTARVNQARERVKTGSDKDELLRKLASPSRPTIFHAMIGAWKDPTGNTFFFQAGNSQQNGWIAGQMIGGFGVINQYQVYYSKANEGTLWFRTPQGVEVTLVFRLVGGNKMIWFFGGQNVTLTR